MYIYLERKGRGRKGKRGGRGCYQLNDTIILQNKLGERDVCEREKAMGDNNGDQKENGRNAYTMLMQMKEIELQEQYGIKEHNVIEPKHNRFLYSTNSTI